MSEGSSLKLVMEKGPREGETLEFTSRSVVRIGRVVRGNTIAIKDDGISSKHLLIQFDSDSSKWLISDLDSSNGTILNDTKLTPHLPSHLTDGDCIKIGEYASIIVKIEIEATSRLRRRGGAKSGALNKVIGAVENSELGQEAEVKQGRQVGSNSRRARSLKEETVDNCNSTLSQIPEALTIDETDGRETEKLVPQPGKKTRGGRRGRMKNAQDYEPSEKVEPSDVVEEQGVAEDLNLEKEGCEGSARDNGIDVNVTEEIDLEKMTLGEWFDYLEVQLRKEIFDETEVLISEMKQRAQKIHEFRLAQVNAKEKGKRPMD